MSGILVIAEHENGIFKRTAAELIGKAAELAAKTGASVSAAVVGDAPAADLGQFGATKVFQMAGDFSAYSTHNTVAALSAIVEQAQPAAILAPASYGGRDALPRLAARLDSGLATDCTDLGTDGDQIVGRRPLYSGKLFADVKIAGTGVFSVRPNSFPQPVGGGAAAEVVTVSADLSADPVTIVEAKTAATEAIDLTEAERIVSGGRSLKSEDQFDDVIRPLAQAIGATVGASRAAVDAGYAPHSDQVGQTGKTVNPTLYIAAGISGAIQHLAGMRSSKVIVAINKDPEAPIFEHATYGIVADLFEVCPKLQAQFEALN